MNVIEWLEYKLTNYNSAVHCFNHYITWTPPYIYIYIYIYENKVCIHTYKYVSVCVCVCVLFVLCLSIYTIHVCVYTSIPITYVCKISIHLLKCNSIKEKERKWIEVSHEFLADSEVWTIAIYKKNVWHVKRCKYLKKKNLYKRIEHGPESKWQCKEWRCINSPVKE